jgi:histidinol phosphatase-like PHP family hydrolase
MPWRPLDCHAHSIFSDGELAPSAVLARVTALGVRASISDHISRDVARSITEVDVVRKYLDVLESLDVLRGGEFCWHDHLWRELPDDVVKRFTHRIGSLHAVRMPDGSLIRAFMRKLPSGLTVERYMAAHVASFEQLTRDMPVDIFGHPTLVTIPFRTHDIDELWTEERETRMVDALHKAGIAFEISARYPPHERIVRRAINRGVRISLGSDGHTRVQVGDVSRPLAMARLLGARDDELYDPMRHGSKTGAMPKKTRAG